jgi:hypothetical protein
VLLLELTEGLAVFYRTPDYEALAIAMIPVDFFGCKREQIVTCSWEDACDRFPCTGITIPDTSALISLSEALTGSRVFSAELVPLSAEPFYELGDHLKATIREATADDLMDAGDQLDINPMDLAGFLLDLHSLVHGPGKEENSIFLSIESGDLPSS